MKAVILAAGYATRLYPLTENLPKCLLEVGGRTILESIARKLEAVKEVDELIIVTNAKFYGVMEEWRKKTKLRFPARVINDGTTSNDNRLGATGDLGLAIRDARIDDDVLMMASDNLFDQSLTAFAKFAVSHKPAVTIAMYDLGDPKLGAKKFGIIEADKTGKVVGIEEKPEVPKSSLIGMGVYFFPGSSLRLVPKYLNTPDAQDAPGHYIRWLTSELEIFGFEFKGMWYDIGDLKALEEANRTFRPQD